MTETAPAIPAAAKTNEEVVGRLIGLPGLDLTLVRTLAGLAASSTDQLTLEAINGDVAVIDWHSPAEIAAALNQAGFAGTRSPHPDDPTAPPAVAGSRRIYAFDLNQFSKVDDLLAALTSLQSNRQVRTFSIGSLSPPPADTTKGKSGSPQPPSAIVSPPIEAASNHGQTAVQLASDKQAESEQVKTDGQQTGRTLELGTNDATEKSISAENATDPSGRAVPIDLDDLIDQLDRSDT